MRIKLATILALSLAACAPSAPTVQFASENAIAVRYTAWDSVPTLTAEALDLAARHCGQYGKVANYKGGNAVSELTAAEVHNFTCDNEKADDGAVIGGQNQRPSYVPVATPVIINQ